MKRPNYLQLVSERVYAAEPGAVFIPSDFFDIAETVKVNMCLSRLVERGELNRIMHGVYAKPRYSTLLGSNVPPYSDNIAKAIARNYGWTVIPCGDTALNMLGLSTQVPATIVYVSDGPYKRYNADGVALRFKRTNSKNEIVSVSYKTALVIQALKAVGKDNVTDEILRKLSKLLSDDEKMKALTESQRITAWVHNCIKKVCTEDYR
jgi:predicted transcriptional regulator of viral defense system